jgi:hypothetical protein
MKLTLYCIALMFMVACGKPSESTTTEDTTQVADNPEVSDVPDSLKRGSEQLNRLLADFDVAGEGYPSISFTQENEGTTYHVTYLFENDNLMWVQKEEAAKEGPDSETYLVSREPEGTYYLHYETKVPGTFGYAEEDGGDWYTVSVDDDFNPYVIGTADDGTFDYEPEFEQTMNYVRSNRDKFVLNNGYYNYEDKKTARTYRFTEVLFESNLLSPTRFDAAFIKPYLNWWYPLYDESGTLKRHQLCGGEEDYIKIVVEAGNYRWEEEAVGTQLVYSIKGFEESEGDAFYATIEMSGHRFKKTLIITENENDADKLLIDGRTYTKEPSRYDIVKANCN